MKTTPSKIKVLIVDDSVLTLTILKSILEQSPDFNVVAMARNGREALSILETTDVDVISLDLHMPVMDGYEMTKILMAKRPKPILVTSISVQENKSTNIFKLLEAGAIDVFPKPEKGFEFGSVQALAYINKLRLISKVRVFKHRSPMNDNDEEKKQYGHEVKINPNSYLNQSQQSKSNLITNNPELVAIGGSTGAPEVFSTILSSLPKNYPLPILCVQHISEGFINSMIEWLDSKCKLKVKLAEQGEKIQKGYVYFPKDGYHMTLTSQSYINLTRQGDKVNGHMPSIDVLFESLHSHHSKQTIAIILTGMGKDGAYGINALARDGAITIAQDKSTSAVYGMPLEALKLGLIKFVMSPPEIADYLNCVTTEQTCG
ncbi:MAG: chemotaxis-specific protein-glutamate methyltransferase CheB [Gammaproteobacteria bacterium]|nr:chemotaxis-specific protein-glutamate methyltransferase CheB [Gammaproteobacteria bacterium]